MMTGTGCWCGTLLLLLHIADSGTVPSHYVFMCVCVSVHNPDHHLYIMIYMIVVVAHEYLSMTCTNMCV